MKPTRYSNINRRNFLKVSAAGVLGTSILNNSNSLIYENEPKIPKIKDYRTLGRTGFRVSDISIGGTTLMLNTQAHLLRILLASGMNYIDTSPIYGPCETIIGGCMNEIDRKTLFISTKFFPKTGFTKDDVLYSFRRSLSALKTEYIDCYQMQNCLSSELVTNENWHAALKQLKEEGRLRFAGVACHGTAFIDSPRENMEEVLTTALNDGRYDLFLLVYNFMNHEQGKRIMQECKKKGIATTIMKTNPVQLLNNYTNFYNNESFADSKDFIEIVIDHFKDSPEEAKSFMKLNNINDFNALRDAAIKFILNNDDVYTIPLSFQNIDDIIRFVALSGQRLSSNDTILLKSYENSYGRLYCRHACGICESACPNHVPVNTLLRFRHYLVGNSNEAYALREYNRHKGPNASLCLNCEGFCEKVCPFKVPAQALLVDAHRNLNLG
jgi:predicted aldo/keto reductase-like oxidoreductase